MAYGLKYYFTFKDNATDAVLTVNIYKDAFAGSALLLVPSESPLIVNESNNEEDIFSPIRAREFKIRFISDNSTFPGIEDFLTNDDNTWKIEILLGANFFAYGFLLTDQMSEEWLTDGTNHVIEISATDNLAALKKVPLTGFRPTDRKTLLDIVTACLNEAVPDLPINIYDNLYGENFLNRDDTTGPFINYVIQFAATSPDTLFLTEVDEIPAIPVGTVLTLAGTASNDGNFTVVSASKTLGLWTVVVVEAVTTEVLLFGAYPTVGFTVTVPVDTLDAYQQTKVDMRTFVTNYSVFEDCYTILEKILASRTSVLFQKDGEWRIVRVPELFQHDTIKGTRYTTITEAVTWNNQANISQTDNTKPVESFIIKSYTNPVLYNKVIFNYENFDEIFCNLLFKRGSNTLDTPTVKEYGLESWLHLKGAILSTDASTVTAGRRVLTPGSDLQVTDEYVFIEYESGPSDNFIKSCEALVTAGDKIDINFQRRLKNGYTGSGTERLMRVIFYATDASHYTLDDDGTWSLSNSTFTSGIKNIQWDYGASDDRSDWVSKSVTSKPFPKDGKIFLYLYEGALDNFTGQETHFKDLRISILYYIEGKNFITTIGDYDKLTIDANLKDTKDYTVYLSDSFHHLLKGALYEIDGFTLTKNWYEMYDDTILYPVKRWNAIAHYFMSYRNMQKAEGTFFGWEAISTLCKAVFINGNPFKSFLPLYLRDIDTSKGQFSTTFIEVAKKDTVTDTVTATVNFKVGGLIRIYSTSDIFEVGSSVVVTGSDDNDGTYLVTAVTTGTDYLGDYTELTYTEDDPFSFHEEYTAGVTFSVTYMTDPVDLVVDAAHEFEYIFKNQ